MFPTFPQTQVILTEKVSPDPTFNNLRIVRYQSNSADADHYRSNLYQFQHQPAEYTVLPAVLCRKGFVSSQKFRVVATVHLSLKSFVDVVKYNPAEPPIDDYEAQGMKQA